MRRFIVILLAIISFSSLSATICTARVQCEKQNPVVMGYYENWSQYRPASGGRSPFFPRMIDPTILTDINFAFAIFGFVTHSICPSNPHLTGDFKIQPVEWNDQQVLYGQIEALKEQAPYLKTFLSIGGWSFNDPYDPNGIGRHTYQLFSQMTSTEASRRQFIESAIHYAHQYGFNGIDIAWEYPGDLTRGGAEEDFDNFILFLKECKAAFQITVPPLLLSYASPAVIPAGVPQKYHDHPELYFKWLAECVQHVDRLNLMALDYHSPFDDSDVTSIHAPIVDPDPTSALSIQATLKNYLENGVPANKIVLGLPAYGHCYGEVSMSSTDYGPGLPFKAVGPPGPSTQFGGLLAYYEIKDLLGLKKLRLVENMTTPIPFAYNLKEQTWVSFDTQETIEGKASLAKNKGLLGVLIWAIDMDEYEWLPRYPNILTAYKVFYPPIDYQGGDEFSTFSFSESPSPDWSSLWKDFIFPDNWRTDTESSRNSN